VSESGGGADAEDDSLHAAHLADRSTPRHVTGTSAGLLSADERVVRSKRSTDGGFVAVEVRAEKVDQFRAEDDLAGSASFANPVEPCGVEVEVPPLHVDDLGGADSGESEADQQFVAQSGFGAVLARSDENAEGFVMGEPACGMGALHFAVEPWDAAQRVVSARKCLDQRRIRLPDPHAPAEKRADPRQPIADRVVRDAPMFTSAPGQHVRFGERAWMRTPRDSEEVRQLGFVLVPGLRVRVTARELSDEIGDKRWTGMEPDDVAVRNSVIRSVS
jgi:hypothetical protein